MKKRRILAAVLSVVFVLQAFSLHAYALSDEELPAPSACLMEAETGKVLYEKASHDQRPCASVTKVMTLLLVMEALDDGKIHLDDQVTASEHAASMGGSDIWLKEGETMSVDDMLKATVIASANDAAVALAEFVAGSEDAFLAQMNEKAKALGMNDTTFKNCNGLDEDGHVTSAYDVAVMSRELMKHQKIFDYTGTWMDSLRDGKTQLVNTNKLLKSYKGITGLKTGTTSKAGSCISATAMRDGMHLIAVVLGASNTKDRFNSAATLLNYGFANWSLSALEVPEEAYQPLEIQNGMENEVPVTISNPGSALVSKGKGEEVKSTVSYDEFLEVPIQKGQQVGEITYSIGDETVGSVPILAAKDIEKAELMPVFHLLLQNLFSFSDK